MAHEFLLHFHRSARFIEERPKGVPERVPADASDATTNSCGDEITPFDSPGIPGQLACLERARKNPVLGTLKERLLPPTQEHLGQCRIERHACIGVFGFYIAYHAGHDCSAHEKRSLLPQDVAPLQRE